MSKHISRGPVSVSEVKKVAEVTKEELKDAKDRIKELEKAPGRIDALEAALALANSELEAIKARIDLLEQV